MLNAPILPITHAQLKLMMPNARRSRIEAALPFLNEAMSEYEIDTPLRIAAFLAQIAHESGSLWYVKEIASGRAYEGRKDLGNNYPGDGVRYKGRSYIQITGRANYTACGKALGIDLLSWPERLEEPRYASKASAWWWKSHGLNELADKEEFHKITRRINGGTTGEKERDAFYANNRKVLGIE